MKFAGVYTALVTPFASTGEVDYAVFERLVELQIEGGVAGLVPVRTLNEISVVHQAFNFSLRSAQPANHLP
jgi:4-hydroxy-tetrahydrodipicolinate synthase